jgi:hypothetical protein
MIIVPMMDVEHPLIALLNNHPKRHHHCTFVISKHCYCVIICCIMYICYMFRSSWIIIRQFCREMYFSLLNCIFNMYPCLSVYLSKSISVYACTALCLVLTSSQFLDLFTQSVEPLHGGSARRKASIFTQGNTYTEWTHTDIHSSSGIQAHDPWVRPKTVHALNRAATVISWVQVSNY